jgi:glutathione reductase (NADPH)
VASERTLDWPRFIEHRQRYIGNIHASYRQRLDDLGVVTLRTRGRLVGPGLVTCLDDAHSGWELVGRRVLVATGGVRAGHRSRAANTASIPTASSTWRSPRRASSLVGGGYIAVELAGILSALGSRVGMLVRGQRLLEHFDAELERGGGRAPQACRRRPALRGRGRGRSPGDGLLSPAHAGRRPEATSTNCSGRSGGRPTPRAWGLPTRRGLDDGRTDRSRRPRTHRVPGVFAIGDVASLGPQLTPLAVRAGRALSDQLFGGALAGPLLDGPVPTVVFGRPPLGSIGESEARARELWGDGAVRVYRGHFRPMLAALAGSELRALVKLVCVGEEERVVGLHVAGPGRRRDAAGLRGRDAHGRDQGRLRCHRGDPSDGRRGAGAAALACGGVAPREPVAKVVARVVTDHWQGWHPGPPTVPLCCSDGTGLFPAPGLRPVAGQPAARRNRCCRMTCCRSSDRSCAQAVPDTDWHVSAGCTHFARELGASVLQPHWSRYLSST